MESRQLISLIKRYYPSSEQANEELNGERVIFVSLLFFYLSIVSFVLLLDKIFGLKYEDVTGSLICIFLMFTMANYLLSSEYSRYINDSISCREYSLVTWPYLLYERIRCSMKLHRRLRQGPYASDLILGTVEAIEAELVLKQATAKTATGKRKQLLETNCQKLEKISSAIRQTVTC